MEPRPRTAPFIRGATPEVRQVAQEMRRALTPAEKVLWKALSGQKVAGLRFRCQHPVGPFVLDFYCAARKLVIEVDDRIHLDPEQQLRDEARTERLEQYGYRVLRFTNDEVLVDLETVLEHIVAEVSGPPLTPQFWGETTVTSAVPPGIKAWFLQPGPVKRFTSGTQARSHRIGG